MNIEIDNERASKICKNAECNNVVARPYWDKTDKYWRYHHTCSSCMATKQKYGLTSPERNKILTSQGGRCRVCDSQISFMGNKTGAVSEKHAVIDHDHESGRIRGIICGRCNIILGKVNDDASLLMRLISYLGNK